MKILHYTPNYSMQTETFIYDQICAVQKYAEFDNVIVASYLTNLESRPFDNIHHIPIKQFISPRITGILAFRFQQLAYFIDYDKWREVLAKEQPDVIHCHTGNGIKTIYHILNKLKLKIPVVIAYYGSDVTSEPLKRRFYQRDLSKFSNAINTLSTVPTHFLKQKAIENLFIKSDKLRLLPNGFSPHFSDNPKCDFYQQGTQAPYKIIMVGRLVSCKGHQNLLHAFSQWLATSGIHSTLTLVGDGPLKPELLTLVNSLGLQEKVEFIASLSHQQVAETMRAHDLYIQASITDPVTLQAESFGVAALEAVSIGLPVIVSDCGGLPEVVDGPDTQARCIYPQHDISALMKSIQKMYDSNFSGDEAFRLAVITRLSQQKNTENIIKIYKELIAKMPS
ncbi:glycosyltransferase [Colwellia sp. D2M02]|uniref:glycosyltransferase n=1 Tax=Colwellia sp. D2M02 TaxID=2841562 RepID=UPI001C081091|nr:glycosyltransferase [Colwellia sp. D2M02]MBU2891922.1 glycosyltransferase [Colwellia sp. D2M02]